MTALVSSTQVLEDARCLLEKIKRQSSRSHRRNDRSLAKTATLENKVLELNNFMIEHQRRSNECFINRTISFFKGNIPAREVREIIPFAKRPINTVTEDVLFIIFKYLKYPELTAASRVCRKWREITESDCFCRKEMRKYFPALCESEHSVYSLAKGFKRCIPLARQLQEDKHTIKRIEDKGAAIVSISIVILSLSVRLFGPQIAKGFEKILDYREANIADYLTRTGMTREAFDEMQYRMVFEHYTHYGHG